ncbi:hypothetical protein [Streptomyces sp. NPDC048644]|uniref:hypothetical protein n=1 Tax=Streptomyces sp. NPDC048644 TaxID=3365582 RepID=UPI003720F06C
MSAGTMAAQAPALSCLAGIAVSHPDLPGAYLVSSQVTANALTVQLKHPAHVEAWREALDVPAEALFMSRIGDQSSLEFQARRYEVVWHVYAVGCTTETAGGAT